MKRPDVHVDECSGRVNAGRSGRDLFLPLLIATAIVLFVVCGLLVTDQPGLYMDAVNPDYQVVLFGDPGAPVTNWIIPGNFVFGRFPVLEGPYTGSYTFYWALPFYWLLGGTILSIRIAHLCVGIVVIGCAAALCFSITRSRITTGIMAVVLALDPAFIYVFRTQGYVVLFPVFFLLLAMLVLTRKPTGRGYALGGLLAGMSSFGYFVYFFALPGLVVFSARDPLVTRRVRSMGAFVAGYAVGASPFVLGYVLLFGALGSQGGLTWIESIFGQLHVNSGDSSYLARASAVAHQIWLVLCNEWEWLSFWSQPYADPGQSIKAWVLIALPCLAVFFARRGDAEDRGFGVVALTVLSYVLVASLFGQRLGGHEFNMLVPLLYVLAAASIALIVRRFPRAGLRYVGAGAAIVALTINGSGTFAIASKLQNDGAAGYYSSVISQYPASVVANHDTSPHIFLDWGAMMAFIYETNGKVPAYDASQLASVMCQYGNAKLVLLGNDVNTNLLSTTLRQNDLVEGKQRPIEDSGSHFIYEVVDVKPRHNGCAPVVATVQPTETPSAVPAVTPAAESTTASTNELPIADSSSPPSSYDFRHGMSNGRPSGVFWDPDASTCCFMGPEANFPLRMRKGARTVLVQVYQPSVTPGPGTVQIDFGGGTANSTFTVPQGEFRTLAMQLPDDIRQRGMFSVRLRDSSTFVPKDQGINGDTRRLGVMIRAVRLQ